MTMTQDGFHQGIPLLSPLRYPGSKRRLGGYIKEALKINGLNAALYIEPFAGGASVALQLMQENLVDKVVLMDADPWISSFWHTVFFDTKWLTDQIATIDVTLEKWRELKLSNPNTIREQALTCFFLNRTSFSGILERRAGPIGGKTQKSQYKINCRFIRDVLINRINQASLHRDKVIDVLCCSWEEGIGEIRKLQKQGKLPTDDVFFYLDPPFFEEAEALYRLYFTEEDLKNLRDFLLELEDKPGELGTNNDSRRLKIHKCPQCGEGPVEVEDIPDQQFCSFCHEEIYPTDCLRIWEEVQDYQSNQVAISRLMLILEHIIPIHYMRYLYTSAPLLLSGMSFFVDDPLAIFGNAAWLHRSIMIFLQEVNRKLAKSHCLPLMVIGLQKTGQVVDHITLINRFIPNNRLFAIEDEYRYKYILANREASQNGFGYETYYGQDFIFKTPTGRIFVFALPYPYASKNEPGIHFVQEKIKFENYPQLPAAIKLITKLESDLYENAVVPIALAHHYTAISLEPGGKVLDLLTKKALKP